MSEKKYPYETLEDWKKAVEKNPKWQNRTAIEMLEELGPEARRFYRAFFYWVGENYPRKDEKRIISQIFPARIYDYSNQGNGRKGENQFSCYSLKDWWLYKENKAEWNGKSSSEMIAMGDEAKSFYFTFYRWLRQEKSITAQQRLAILAKFFPRQNINTLPKISIEIDIVICQED